MLAPPSAATASVALRIAAVACSTVRAASERWRRRASFACSSCHGRRRGSRPSVRRPTACPDRPPSSWPAHHRLGCPSMPRPQPEWCGAAERAVGTRPRSATLTTWSCARLCKRRLSTYTRFLSAFSGPDCRLREQRGCTACGGANNSTAALVPESAPAAVPSLVEDMINFHTSFCPWLPVSGPTNTQPPGDLDLGQQPRCVWGGGELRMAAMPCSDSHCVTRPAASLWSAASPPVVAPPCAPGSLRLASARPGPWHDRARHTCTSCAHGGITWLMIPGETGSGG